MKTFTKLINELKFEELADGFDLRAPIAEDFDIDAQFVDIDLDQLSLSFNTRDLGPQGSRRTHSTMFQINKRKDKQRWKTGQELKKIQNNLPALKAYLINGFFVNGQTNVKCSCESFLYGGFKYITTKNRDNFADAIERRPPREKNPGEFGKACKHCIGLAQNIDQFYNQIVSRLQQKLRVMPNAPTTPTTNNPSTNTATTPVSTAATSQPVNNTTTTPNNPTVAGNNQHQMQKKVVKTFPWITLHVKKNINKKKWKKRIIKKIKKSES